MYTVQNKELNWSSQGRSSKEILLNANELFNGCCLGNSISFLVDYESNISSGQDPLQAIKQTSCHFFSGAPILAEKIQLLHTMFFLTPGFTRETELVSKILSPFKQKSDRPKMEFKYTLLFKNGQINIIDTFTFPELLKGFKATSFISKGILSHSFPSNGLISPPKSSPIKESDKSDANVLEDSLRELNGVKISNHNFSSVFESLPPGEYVGILFYKNSGHAIALIKTTGDKHFIFDSNFGTFCVHEKNMGERMENLFNLYGWHSITFLRKEKSFNGVFSC